MRYHRLNKDNNEIREEGCLGSPASLLSISFNSFSGWAQDREGPSSWAQLGYDLPCSALLNNSQHSTLQAVCLPKHLIWSWQSLSDDFWNYLWFPRWLENYTILVCLVSNQIWSLSWCWTGFLLWVSCPLSSAFTFLQQGIYTHLKHNIYHVSQAMWPIPNWKFKILKALSTKKKLVDRFCVTKWYMWSMLSVYTDICKGPL